MGRSRVQQVAHQQREAEQETERDQAQPGRGEMEFVGSREIFLSGGVEAPLCKHSHG